MKRDVGSFHAMLRTVRLSHRSHGPGGDRAGQPAVRPVAATVGRAPIITAGGRLQNVALSSLLSKALGNNGGWRGLARLHLYLSTIGKNDADATAVHCHPLQGDDFKPIVTKAALTAATADSLKLSF